MLLSWAAYTSLVVRWRCKSYAVARRLTNVQILDIENIVKDLEESVSAHHEAGKHEQEEAGNRPLGPGYISAFDVANSLQTSGYQDPGRVRIV